MPFKISRDKRTGASAKSLKKVSKARVIRKQSRDRQLKIAAKQRKALTARLKTLRDLYKRFYGDKNRYLDTSSEYVALMDGHLNLQMGQFQEPLVGGLKRKPIALRLERLREANAIAQLYIDWFGVTKFVVDQQSVEFLKKQASVWEKGGKCSYRVVKRGNEKIVVLKPMLIRGIKVDGTPRGNQAIHVLERTRNDSMFFHVHVNNMNPSSSDLWISRNYKPDLLISQDRSCIVLPRLVNFEGERSRYSQGSFTFVDIVPKTQADKLWKSKKK